MSSSNEDRPDPSEQPIRARVPEHVARGAFSTGVIVMTAQTEFILDFIQNLGRPHQIVARVVMPHSVLPQLVDALFRNMELYRSRWGELPHIPQLPPVQTSVAHHGPGSSHPQAAPNFGQTTEIAMGQLAQHQPKEPVAEVEMPRERSVLELPAVTRGRLALQRLPEPQTHLPTNQLRILVRQAPAPVPATILRKTAAYVGLPHKKSTMI